MTPRRIYLDHNATSTLLPEVAERMAHAAATYPGNASSVHLEGRRARHFIEECREEIAAALGAHSSELIFTSGGTEANNLALAHISKDGYYLASYLEHPSVLAPVQHHERNGGNVIWMDVGGDGQVRIPAPDRLAPGLTGACLMLANNETGVIQRVRQLVDSLEGRAAPVHCDAVQAAGRLPLSFHALGASTLSIAVHKIHGPTGIGALLVRRGHPIAPMLRGGHQERGQRPGTESVALVAGMAATLRCWRERGEEWRQRMSILRDALEQKLLLYAPTSVINGHGPRLPNTTNIVLPQAPRDTLLARLDLAGIACAAGSACSSGSIIPSPTLIAMGLDEARARGAIRFSLGPETSAKDVEEAAERVAALVKTKPIHRPAGSTKDP